MSELSQEHPKIDNTINKNHIIAPTPMTKSSTNRHVVLIYNTPIKYNNH